MTKYKSLVWYNDSKRFDQALNDCIVEGWTLDNLYSYAGANGGFWLVASLKRVENGAVAP